MNTEVLSGGISPWDQAWSLQFERDPTITNYRV